MAGKPKYTPEERRAVIAARNAAYRVARRDEIAEKARASYHEHRTATGAQVAKKRGRPLKYKTAEERREADRLRWRRSREANLEKRRAASRDASKHRKAERAIAEGRTPGLVGNPKRFATEEERNAGRLAKRNRYLQRNRERVRALGRAARKKFLAKRALAEGRVPGVKGRARRLSDEQRRANARANVGNYRARSKAAPGRYTAADIRKIRKLQHGKCAFCLKPLGDDEHIDHYEPLKRGGSNGVGNLRLLHSGCNLAKGAQDPVEHAKQHGLLLW